ncbi:Protein YdeP [Rubrobacter xylanophilus DSM 9941]|nr:FdhF/YdeP family oxidoreductase [Rubrobacter xylanophilus]QYJ16370.1 Protein YdeP [Rubrobacter xylanophilus DSM 9941]
MAKSEKKNMEKVRKGWDPSLWAGLRPFGIGEERPNNYAEILRAVWENKDEALYAWRILSRGVCDGCALGVAGLHDWTMNGVHLCNIRLRLLRLNTMPALDTRLLYDISSLRGKKSAELKELGRLPYPMIRRRGERGFTRISWEKALDEIAGRIRSTSPERTGYYMTSRGEPNENYYVAQKAVRAMGTNSIDNAARICHSPSTVSLKATIGAGATTCSYSDWIGTDLLVFIGSNPANNQPVTTKYMYYAKKAGTKIAVINSYREPGMERYWIPSNLESALFGTKISDRTFLVNVGGDVAFLNGTLKHMIENGWLDRDFIERHTAGFEEMKAALEQQSWEDLERLSGASREEMREFAKMVGQAKTAVFVWSMGITQHEFGEDNVRAIINLGLTKGFVGRDNCGLMPIRGHSGVQGGAEMGAYSTAFPGGLPINPENAEKLGELYGFEVPSEPGLTTPRMIDAAHEGELDVLVSLGGNFLEVLPDPDYVREALGRVPLRVHVDIVLSNQMLIDPADTVILLPAATRYEIPGGVTQTSTERRIMYSPEIPGRRIGEARPEWEIFMELAKRVRPELADRLHFGSTQEIREEIARVIPMYDGIQHLRKSGDQVQYGGPHLCANWEFKTPDGKAHFSAIELPETEVPEGMFMLTTRRGKQFNSMIHEEKDALTGAVREAVLMSQEDARELGLANGDRVVLRSDAGEFRGRVHIAPIKPRTLQVHWPEGNVLIDRRHRSAIADIPDYNALVRVERAAEREPAAV